MGGYRRITASCKMLPVVYQPLADALTAAAGTAAAALTEKKA
jgi:hypothetical protein